MWLYEDKEFTEVEDYYGFIYLIENLVNGKKYIGRKYLTKAGYKTVKGKRKKLRVESDWRDSTDLRLLSKKTSITMEKITFAEQY